MRSTVQLSSPTGEQRRPEWLPWSRFPLSSRFVEVGGSLVHHVDEGSGPALVFVSAGQWSFMFRDLILRLRPQFRCVALDFPGCGLSPVPVPHDPGVPANADVLAGFLDTLGLDDVILLVHDVGGPIGFLAALARPRRVRALVVSNTFAWPLADYPAVRRTLRVVGSRPFGALNDRTSALALLTASSYGVGRRMTAADRRVFRGPWRSRAHRRATQRIIAAAGSVDAEMADVERRLAAAFADRPVLTLFGARNDPYRWQARFQRIFPSATAVQLPDGHHFPFDDDPDGYASAVSTWWTTTVATTPSTAPGGALP
jgi:haloalkane dehalogenase